jgi:glycosyltransferase involved in cell wall biosynthesis
MKISILIPSRNGVEFLDWSYKSIRKNQGNHFVEILVLDDISDKDNTWEWCENIMAFDLNFKAFKNRRKERLGISSGYKFLSQQATQDVICHWHNDMFMTEGTLDAVERELYDKRYISKPSYLHNREYVVCLTRIEPPIYNKPGVYPEKIIWAEAPIELEDWSKPFFTVNLPHLIKSWGGKSTGGHFAPFFMFRDEYNRLGGNDIDNFPKQAREDSDFAFRLVLAGFKTIQIPHFVYHFASRGNRRSKHESGNFVDNPEWIEINKNSERNFIRKWGTMKLHNEDLTPIKPVKYNIVFVIKNCKPFHLEFLEPWCDALANDLSYEDNLKYVEVEQKNTKFNLKKKILNLTSPQKRAEIIVEIDGNSFDNGDYFNICNLSEIITASGEIGQFELENLKITINAMNHYENDLIVCKNEPISLENDTDFT